ncbi:hypothetical protein D3C84_626200 [compost metagenome]
MVKIPIHGGFSDRRPGVADQVPTGTSESQVLDVSDRRNPECFDEAMVQAASCGLQLFDQRLHAEGFFGVFINVLHGLYCDLSSSGGSKRGSANRYQGP